MRYYFHFKYKEFLFYIIQENDCIISLDNHPFESSIEEKETELIKRTINEINEFFFNKRKNFDIPLKTNGTPFQEAVWKALLQIPYGATRSYSEIARLINNPKSSRAIGMACNKNPIMILIPCHRVVGKNGALVGFGGGLELKQKLLDIEKNPTNN